MGDTYKSRPIVGAPPKIFVSLTDLRTTIDGLRDKQRALMNDLRQPGTSDLSPFLQRQSEIVAAVQRVRAELKKVAQETTPLIEQLDPLATPNADDAKWRYGKPITFRADACVTEVTAASSSLNAKDVPGAVKHQQAVLEDLDAIYKAVGAENGPLEYRPDMSYELAEGRFYHAWKFEAVIGSEVAEKTGLKVGDKFQATHGNPGPNETPDIHKEQWQIVGILKPTHTAGDRCLFIPLVSFYCIAEHERSLDQQKDIQNGKVARSAPVDDDDTPHYKKRFGDELDPDLPHTQDFIDVDAAKDEWQISGVIVKSRGGVTSDDLMYFIQTRRNARGHSSGQPGTHHARFFRYLFCQFHHHSSGDCGIGQHGRGDRHSCQHL